MSVPPASDFQALLAEDRWIRVLAAKLVADASTADDLVQDAYLTALTSDARPREARAWFAGLLRNLWRDLARSGARRERRERGAARPEATASTDELAAEVELRKRVAELVLELDEPLRRALILRFFKDCSLPALAKHEQISVSTAHERVERGLALLRARLDQAHGGERRAWAGVLAALARPRWSGWITGGLTMATGMKIATASLVLAGALIWIGQRTSRGLPAGSITRAEASTGELTGDTTTLANPVTDPSRASRVAESASSTASSSPAALMTTLRGRVLDSREAPLAGIPIGSFGNAWSEVEASGRVSAADGSFEIPWPSQNSNPRPVALDPGRAALACDLVDGEWLLVLSDTAAYSGLVVDESGNPLAGVEVKVQPRPTYFRERGYLRPIDPAQPSWEAKSDAFGHFELPAAPAGDSIVVSASLAGFVTSWAQVPPGEERDAHIVLRRGDGILLTGTVVDAAGEPLSEARVATGRLNEAVSGADGSFSLFWRPSDVRTFVMQDGTEYRRSETHLHAFKEGYGPARVELTTLDVHAPIVLTLRPALAIRGRVVDTHGAPLQDVVVQPADPTPLVGNSPAAAVFDFQVEGYLHRDPPRTASDGSFVLDQLCERTYQLLAFDPYSACLAGPVPVAAGASDVVLVVDRERGTERVAGRLVTAEGAPVAGAIVGIVHTFPEFPVLQVPPWTQELETDEDGRFEVPPVTVAGSTLSFFHPDFFYFTFPLERLSDLQHLELVAPALCELQIELADPALADSARILDADDRPLGAIQVRGVSASMEERLRLSGGKSEVVRMSVTAHTLVLYKGGAEVLRLPLRLDPDQRTVFRP